MELVSWLFALIRLERLEVKKWHLFIAILGEKLLQNNQSLQNFA